MASVAASRIGDIVASGVRPFLRRVRRATLGGWLGRVLGLYREGEATGFIMAVVGTVIILGIYRLVLPGRTRI